MTNHCTYAQAIALKKIGFDMPTDYVYGYDGTLVRLDIGNYVNTRMDVATSAPTRSEVLQWAREKKGIHGEVSIHEWDKEYAIWYYIKPETEVPSLPEFFPSWDEAEDALVWKIIEILKEQKV